MQDVNNWQGFRAQQEERERFKKLQNMQKGTFQWLGDWDDSALTGKTFENFEQGRQQNAYNIIRKFANDLEGHIILRGSYGTGKTHLLAALCNELRNRTKPIGSRFAAAPSLFHAIQDYMKSDYDEPYTDLIRKAINTPLLVLDDIDKAKYSEFREEIYFDIIDGRTKNGKPTAISSNRTDIAQFLGGACASRLSIGLIEIDMVGGDYRPELV